MNVFCVTMKLAFFGVRSFLIPLLNFQNQILGNLSQSWVVVFDLCTITWRIFQFCKILKKNFFLIEEWLVYDLCCVQVYTK